jgi:two-component system, NarL family, nitrate/nitrite response regulator NarL
VAELRSIAIDPASSRARHLIGAESPVAAAELAVEPARANLLILSDIRFMREGLAEVFGRDDAFETISVAADPGEAIVVMRAALPDLVLIDAALPDGLTAVGRLRRLAPKIRIIALAVAETEAEIIAWAAAGACGYVPRSAALADLVGFLSGIMRGEQTCSTRVAAGLMRWIADGPRIAAVTAHARPALTVREEEIASLIAAGLSNKEIARRLKICLPTTKSHVHNILGKLELERRGQVSRWLRENPSL